MTKMKRPFAMKDKNKYSHTQIERFVPFFDLPLMNKSIREVTNDTYNGLRTFVGDTNSIFSPFVYITINMYHFQDKRIYSH